MGFSSAVVLFAHPDDGDFMCGATTARWAREGTAVHYVVITDGSAGDNRPGADRAEVAQVREREQRAAAEVLGVRSVTFLGFRDGELEVNLDTRRAVCRELRRIRPQVLVAPDPRRWWTGNYVNHADHRAAGELAMSAVMPDVPSRPQFPELLDEGFEPYEIPNLWISTFEDADTHVDVAATLDVKIAALARHESQGVADAEPWVRQRARELGEPVGLAAAETFRTFVLREEPQAEPEGEA
ncbi:MAG: PIG-L deacetylase family protein [Actinomycetota bacterium]